MRDWWLRLLGVDAQGIPSGAQVELVQTHQFHSWQWLVFLAVVAVVIWGVFYFYRREINTCPPAIKWLLGCLRGLTVLVLAVVLLGPALAVSQRRTVQPDLVVLVDDSLSMGIADDYTNEAAAARGGAV